MVEKKPVETMVPLGRAIELVDGMRRDFYASLESNSIPVSRSLGRRLASDVLAEDLSPRFDTSTVDGYALRLADGYPVRVARDVYAGDRKKYGLAPGEAVYTATGAAIPVGADAVLKIEDALVEGDAIVSGPTLKPGENVIPAGSDFSEGEAILEKDTAIGPSAICLLNAADVAKIRSYRRIRFGVLATGEEIRNGMVRDCNSPMVCAMLRLWGCEATMAGVVPDDAAATKAMLDSAADRFDALITIGGVSVGKKDYIVSTIRADGNVVFQGYRVRPGKPLLVSIYRGKPVFSLPGKPTGSFTAMELVVKHFVLGHARTPSIIARLAVDMDIKSDDYDLVVYVKLDGDAAVPMGFTGSPLELFPVPGYRVSIVSSSTRAVAADGYILTCMGMKAGDGVKVILL